MKKEVMEEEYNVSTVLTTIFQNLKRVTTEMSNTVDNNGTTILEYAAISYPIDETTQVNMVKTVATSSPINSTRICTTTTTEEPFDEFGPPDGVEYIFVPLGVMIFVVILTAVVLIISRRRKMERLRHRLMPLYNFDPSEEGEDDWETELLDEGLGRTQRRGYQSMDNEENAELFSH
ncbi:uncharacterized protein C3orf18 homolog isoform X2 [Fopius arisanus]|uniref:Uncharacterized protein C3orf18 homolog isoform X2 n=1 Tax=Fopius arisanus TaxID=64838 RepID=A0A9R1U6K8_9HYME|nr:PREDICTED: uncharacterized protein C3orf18 homolog isoform X2 [Fopius arisanus]